MWETFSKIHPVHSLFSITKNDLSWLKNLFMVMFQLMRMSSYAKNKLQMCLVTQHQFRRCQMWGKFSQIHPVYTLLSVTKMTNLDWTIYSWNGINLLGRPLMLRTSYRAKCAGNFHKFTEYTHFLSVSQMTCLDWTIYSW